MMLLLFIDGVKKMEKKEKLNSLLDEFTNIDYSGFIMTEYREYRLQALAEKIKSQNYRPKIKLYGF